MARVGCWLGQSTWQCVGSCVGLSFGRCKNFESQSLYRRARRAGRRERLDVPWNFLWREGPRRKGPWPPRAGSALCGQPCSEGAPPGTPHCGAPPSSAVPRGKRAQAMIPSAYFKQEKLRMMVVVDPPRLIVIENSQQGSIMISTLIERRRSS